MTTDRLVEKSVKGETHIAVLTLNRPEKRNALSDELIQVLIDDLKEISADQAIRVIVLRGAGPCFCAGLDLYDLQKSHRSERRWGAAGTTHEVIHLLRNAPQVTIAAVRGHCLGNGLALVNSCDLAVASETAQFGMPEIIRGSYGATATPSLFHTGLPFKVAFRIQLTGKNLTGAEAARLGLVSSLASEAEFDRAVSDLASDIAQRDRVALAHAKIAAYTACDLPFAQALQVDELVSHRMRHYVDPTRNVGEFLKSQHDKSA